MGSMTTMTYLIAPSESRPLHQGGPRVSSVAWGMWRFRGTDVGAARSLILAALDAGVTLFDTADIYGPDNGEGFGASEALLGQVLAASPELASRMVIATKGGIVIGTPYNSSETYVASAIDASLRRMGVEHVALWQIHRPDILTHPAETARALEAAHKAGKIGAVGVSNYTPSQVEALAAHLSLPVVSCQPEFSPLAIDPLSDGVLDQAVARAVALILDEIAETFSVSRAAAAYSWIMAHPAQPIPIVGTQTPERIAEIPDAYKPRWTRTDWYRVLVASMGAPLP
jgi:predicted oxidoreductase